MIRMLIFGTILALATPVTVTASSAAGHEVQAGEVRADLEKTLDLWRDGRYDAVYERVIEKGSHSKEYFVTHLAVAPRKPACCWEKLQEVRVSAKGSRQATFHARFGFDAGTGTEFMTREVKLEKEDGIWKIKMSDLLTMAGKGAKMSGGKKKKN